jgi:BirA family biotin operon repressor/biotin-[acetyl-CoA-carboxylase] ligase
LCGGDAAPTRAWVIGFGINCLQHLGHFPPELASAATSLELAASHAVDRLAVIRALLMRLDHWLGQSDWFGDRRLEESWASMVEPVGRRVRLRHQSHEYAGRTVRVDPVGGLTVQLDNGRQMWFDPMLTSVLP